MVCPVVPDTDGVIRSVWIVVKLARDAHTHTHIWLQRSLDGGDEEEDENEEGEEDEEGACCLCGVLCPHRLKVRGQR